MPERKIVYPEIIVNGMVIPADKRRIIVQRAKEILGWETEGEYKARLKAADPDSKKAAEASYGEEFMLKDENGEKVRCANNPNNRPFTDSHARSLAQDILNHNWQFNCETIIISKRGVVESGQHRLIGLILADQMWRGKNKAHWQEVWKEEPWIESLIVFGAEDDPKVVMTLDNVRPRSASDVIYTSPLFAGLDPLPKKECSRMLASGLDLLWVRSGAGSQGNSFHKYQTHSETLNFQDRHPKIVECVHEIFKQNKSRRLSKITLQPGGCAAMLYMQGCSQSDGDEYRNSDPPSEKVLNWDNWERALLFWAKVGQDIPEFKALNEALKDLKLDEEGLGGRLSEKLALIALAWDVYGSASGDVHLLANDIKLEYSENEETGQRKLATHVSFNGIDLGEDLAKEKDKQEEESPEKVEERKAAERARKTEEVRATLRKKRELQEQVKAAKPTTPVEAPKGKKGPAPKPPLKGGTE